MDRGINPDFGEQIAAVLDWWRVAGVDLAFSDEPKSWLRAKEAATHEPPASIGQAQVTALPRKGEPRVSPPPPLEDLPADLPEDLLAFQAWWMSAPELAHAMARVPPRGNSDPALMIVTACPEDDDRDQLLSGPEGSLLSAFLKAAGIAEDAVYRASVMPSHGPAGEWESHAPLLAASLIRHVALVRPARLLMLGSSILPLLGHSSPQRPAVWDVFNHEGLTIPMLAIRRVPALASQPRWKSGLWQAWLEGTV